MSDKEFGVNIWWHIPEFVMNGDRAQSLVCQHGFEIEDLPLPSRRSVVSRAAYSFQDRRHNDNRKVTEKAKDSSDTVVYGILSQVRKNSEEVGYDQGTTIHLNKADGSVTAFGPLADDFYKSMERYDGGITDVDIRQFLRKVVKMAYGVSKRVSGGIYFIPERYAFLVNDAQQILEGLGVGARLYVERVMNGEQERANVWDAVENDIEGQIEQTLKAVDRIEKRVSSVQNHETKIQELNGLMDIYRQLLGQEAKYEDLQEKLVNASSHVAGKLTELQDAANKANRKGSSGKGGVGQQVINLALIVLKQAGEPLHYREIAKRVEARGFELRGKDGGAWLNSWIAETFRGGANSPFKR
jgi:hypothetical protein